MAQRSRRSGVSGTGIQRVRSGTSPVQPPRKLGQSPATKNRTVSVRKTKNLDVFSGISNRRLNLQASNSRRLVTKYLSEDSETKAQSENRNVLVETEKHHSLTENETKRMVSLLKKILKKPGYVRTDVEVCILATFTRSFKFFQNYQPHVRRCLSRALRLVRIRANSYIYNQGCVHVFKVNSHDHVGNNIGSSASKSRTSQLYAGDAFGGAAFYGTKRKREFTVQAMTNCLLLQLPLKTFETLRSIETLSYSPVGLLTKALKEYYEKIGSGVSGVSQNKINDKVNFSAISSGAFQGDLNAALKKKPSEKIPPEIDLILTIMRNATYMQNIPVRSARWLVRLMSYHYVEQSVDIEVKDMFYTIMSGTVAVFMKSSFERQQTEKDETEIDSSLSVDIAQTFSSRNSIYGVNRADFIETNSTVDLRRSIFGKNRATFVDAPIRERRSLFAMNRASFVEHEEDESTEESESDSDSDRSMDSDNSFEENLYGSFRGNDMMSSWRNNKLLTLGGGKQASTKVLRRGRTKTVNTNGLTISSRDGRGSITLKAFAEQEVERNRKYSSMRTIESRQVSEWHDRIKDNSYFCVCILRRGDTIQPLGRESNNFIYRTQSPCEFIASHLKDYRKSSEVFDLNREATTLDSDQLTSASTSDPLNINRKLSNKQKRATERRDSRRSTWYFGRNEIPKQIDTILSQMPYERNRSSMAVIEASLSNMPFFLQLPLNVRLSLYSTMSIKDLKSGELLFREGDSDTEHMYVVLRGSLSLHKRITPPKNNIFGFEEEEDSNFASIDELLKDETVMFLGIRESFGACEKVIFQGQSVGEFESLDYSSRVYSAVAREPSTVIEIDRADFMKTLNSMGDPSLRFQHRGRNILTNSLKSILEVPPMTRTKDDLFMLSAWASQIPIMKNIPQQHLIRICDEIMYVSLRDKEVVYEQEDLASHVYFIVSGSVSMHRRGGMKLKLAKNNTSSNAGKKKKKSNVLLKFRNCARKVVKTSSDRRRSVELQVKDLPDREGDLKKIAKDIKDYGDCIGVAFSSDAFGESCLVGLRNNRETAYRESTVVCRGSAEVCILSRNCFQKYVDDNIVLGSAGMIKQILTKPKGRRSLESSQALEQLLWGISFFRELFTKFNVQRQICNEITYAEVGKASVIFKQGSQGNLLYILLNGQVEIRQKNDEIPTKTKQIDPLISIREDMLPPDTEDWELRMTPFYGKKVASLKSGDVFGEMALKNNAPRNASIISTTNCELLLLSRSSYENTLQKHVKNIQFRFNIAHTAALASTQSKAVSPEEKGREMYQIVKHLDVFTRMRNFDYKLVETICSRMKYRNIPIGSSIVARADPATEILILLSGQIQLISKSDVAIEYFNSILAAQSTSQTTHTSSVTQNGMTFNDFTTIANLDAGAIVGELEIILGVPLQVSAKATMPSSVVCLGKADYEELWPKSFRTNGVLQMVNNIPLFEKMSSKEKAIIGYLFKCKTFPKGATIFEQDEQVNSMAIIKSGECKLISTVYSKSGTRRKIDIEVSVLCEGQFYGDRVLVYDKTEKEKEIQCNEVTKYKESLVVSSAEADIWLISFEKMHYHISPTGLTDFSVLSTIHSKWRESFRTETFKAALPQLRDELDINNVLELKKDTIKGELGELSETHNKSRSVRPEETRNRGNTFMGGSWLDVHLENKAEAAARSKQNDKPLPKRPRDVIIATPVQKIKLISQVRHF